jgi:zinc and cadmium transporter
MQHCCVYGFAVVQCHSSAPLLLQIILACLLGGVLSIAAAALIMFGLPRKWLAFTISFSTGLLLAMAMLHLLPEALEMGLTPHEVFPLLLAGILGFFALEKFAIWRHSHHDATESDAHQGDHQCTDHTHAHHHTHGPQGETLSILVGDSFHNFTDGLLIAAAFLADPSAGLDHDAGHHRARSAAGSRRFRDSALCRLEARPRPVLERRLQPDGHCRRRCRLSSRSTMRRNWIPFIITIAASSFLYVAIADLMPRLKREQRGRLAQRAARRRHRRHRLWHRPFATD